MKRFILILIMALCMTSITYAAEVEQEIEVEIIEEEEDDNAFLKSLSVSTGELEPEFTKEQLSYSISVSNDVTEVEITAEPESEYAEVLYIQGNRNLKEGENKALIDVKAENGDILTYTISITRAESEDDAQENNAEGNQQSEENTNIEIPKQEKSDVEITYNGTAYKVKSFFDDIIVPDGFTENTVVIDGKEVTSFISDAYKIQIIFAKEPGANTYDIYRINDSKFEKCIWLTNNGNSIFVLQAPDGTFGEEFQSVQIKIENSLIDAYQMEDGASNLYYFYGVNQNGNYEVYIYDQDTQMITQQSDFEQAEKEEEVVNNTGALIKVILLVLGVVAVAAIVTIIFLIRKIRED